jgi:hypothetical protein
LATTIGVPGRLSSGIGMIVGFRSSDRIGRAGCGRGRRLASESDAEVGQEAPSVWIFDQMQNACEETALILGPADVDNGSVLEAVIEEANEALARVVFQRVEDFVNHHPAGLVLPYPDDERAKAFPLRAQKKLIAAPGSLNILHSPPIYSFLARLPFWLTDTLTHGTAPPIFSEQHPSLLAIRALIFFQHVGLWFALRYLLFSVGWSDISRGIAAVLLSSVASFYTFGHTAGSEAVTAVIGSLSFPPGFVSCFDVPVGETGLSIRLRCCWQLAREK